MAAIAEIVRQAQRRVNAITGVDVVYQRDAQKVELRAGLGKTEFQVADGYGVENFESTDFLPMAEDLVLDEGETLPERGDQIHYRRGDKVDTYEVMAPGRNPHWQWAGAHHTRLRIHTKLIETN